MHDPQPRLESVTCPNPLGLHRMAYWEWGEPDNDRIVLCVHGLTRTGRDFDTLARQLSDRYRVICPDVVGRGRSDWLPQGAPYGFPQYVSDMLVLWARLRPGRLVWVGTSMGGLIALSLLLGLAQRSAACNGVGHGLPADIGWPRLDGLILNDVGPHIDAAGLSRIAGYVGQPVGFGEFRQAVDYIRSVSAGFGPHDDAQWEALTRHVFVEQGGVFVKHYDLRIAEGLQVSLDPTMAAVMQQQLWQAYESLAAPVLVLRGEQSDILSAEQARQMQARHACARLVQVAGVGHAPTLMHADTLEPVDDFVSACLTDHP